MSLLRVQNLSARYGVSQALFDISLDLAEGQVLALLGRNGMGKTTTIKAICRMIMAKGVIEFAGQNVLRLPSYKVARLGVGLVPEGRRCFAPLTVAENLTAAARPGPWDMAAVGALFPRLAERQGQIAGSLSGGEQQMLAIARALMTNPRLLILDEATEGLAPLVRGEIWDAIRILKRDSGLSILVVDKSLRELSDIADNAVIIQRGTSVWHGPMGAVDSGVREQYLGV
ncbi:ABC transporter ATP-binding protein [Oceaniglobus ichthyenteri]|uniref:ABC transporter ATP-binding protein n=1 Tax=Oceaniglobus ichthyenteri TaxID=2136177 RepID=UPI000D39CA7C|nr:ABC transporter ATP-binding protein [Oceaniglobus ichthyenteri]